jgi:hypothetical protein
MCDGNRSAAGADVMALADGALAIARQAIPS